jgi:outer membrane protein assembly factor BamD
VRKEVFILQKVLVILVLCTGLLGSCGFHRKKYDNPISKDTRQPDKVLFDKSVSDIEHGRFEVARITLNTLINTYDQSEFLAKAKLAIADSWYREGGSHGLAQAEAEYKDFILFYPTMEEAPEAQMRICDIHYKQMDKADRDSTQALRAEDECRNLITTFPNSKFVPEAQQRVREVQEAIAQGEFMVGDFYHHKGSNPASANRMARLVDQYPLYSGADEALWEMADSWTKMGGSTNRFKQRAVDAYSRIVRDYPLSARVDDAKRRLKELEAPIPEADPAALARMQYDKDHPVKHGYFAKALNMVQRGPDVSKAARTGTPAMTTVSPTAPVSVPVQPGAIGTTDVTGTSVPEGSSALDKNPDARTNLVAKPTPAGTATQAASPQPTPTDAPVSNHQAVAKKKDKKKKKTPETAPQVQPADATKPADPAKPADPTAK